MSLFNFNLKPLTDCSYWLGNENRKAHQTWYGLSDGFFWMEVNNQKLLEYTPSFMREFYGDETTFHNDTDRIMDHYLAQIYSDLEDVFDTAFNPIPLELFSEISTLNQMLEMEKKANSWTNRAPDTMESFDIYMQSTFFNRNRLDLGYLLYSPKIWFLRIEDDIVIRWNTNRRSPKRFKVWTSTKGEIKISIHLFKAELISFYQSFIKQMKIQVQNAINSWPLKDVEINTKGLLESQNLREIEIESIVEKIINEEFDKTWDWEKVKASIMIVKSG